MLDASGAGPKANLRPKAGTFWPFWTGGALLAAFILVSFIVGVLRAPEWNPFWAVIQLVAAAVAAGASAWTAARCSERRRRAWGWLSAGVLLLAAQVHDGREQLRHTGLHDELTGLPNRDGFLDLVEKVLAEAAYRPFAVVKLGPANPRLLDTLAPDETDAVLFELAGRISGCTREDDRLARVSETSFAVLMVGDSDAAVGFARRVMLAADAPVPTGYRRLHVGLAAGIAAASAADPDTCAAVLIQRAATSLSSLTALHGGVAVFDPSMLRAQAAHLELREVVARALSHDTPALAANHDPPPQAEPLFEPVVELSTGRLVGIAAQLGMRSDAHGVVSPEQLVTLARESGLAERVDEALLAPAIAWFGAWNGRWSEVCGRLWIGVCAETLSRPGFLVQFQRLLGEAGLPAGRLVLEPLDCAASAAAGDAVARALEQIRGLGVRIVARDSMALSGYAPLPGGTEPQADYFDISPVLVDRCTTDLRARRLVQATAEFAASHRAKAAARQVGTVEQHEELLQAGCSLARGPLYGGSLCARETEDLLATVAAGTWRTPAGHVARRHRSSRAWQELRKVISGLPIAAFACGADGTLDLAEGALLDQLGIGVEAIDQPLVDLLRGDLLRGDLLRGDPAEDSDNPLENAVRAAFDGTPTVSTVRARGRWLQVHLCPDLDRQGTVNGVLGVAFDVTHRMQAEDALRRSEQRFKSVFADAPVGMAIVAPDTAIQEVNHALASMLGYLPEELVGRTLLSLSHLESPSEASRDDDEVRSGRTAGYRAERVYRHRDGSAVWSRITVGPLVDDGAPDTIIGVVEDLRPVKALEVELRHAQKLEAVGMLAAGIAHEINTPIQFVGDNLNFLAESFQQLTDALTATQRLCLPVDGDAGADLARILSGMDLPWLVEEVPEAVRQSLSGVARMASIVGAMRNFGHPDGEDPSPVDIDAAIRDTATVARSEYKYVADLHLNLGDVPPVLGYPSQFHQVMLNLIVNAAHAIDHPGRGPARGTIRVRSWADDTTVRVSVADDGCGMTAQTRARIFDPFFTTKAVGRGTGQGLTIVHNVVVDKHAGVITVDSAPGEGSTFTLCLPRGVTGQEASAPTPAAVGSA